MSDRTNVVLVGHCRPDGFMMRNALRGVFGDPEISEVNSQSDLDAAMASADVLLVNRVLDGRFDAELGQELIGRLTEAGTAPSMLLVSDLADAQIEAEAAGALPGFGKRSLHESTTRERLLAAVS